MHTWLRSLRRIYTQSVVEGRLIVITCVLALASWHLLADVVFIWVQDIPLRKVPLHPIDVMFKGVLGLGVPLGLLFVWHRYKPVRRVVRVYDWFGGGLLALAACLIFATPDELFRMPELGPAARFLISFSWPVWALAGTVLMVAGVANLSTELNSERRENQRLEALMGFTRQITSLDYQHTLDQVVRHLYDLLSADSCMLFLWREDEQVLAPMSAIHNRNVYSDTYIARMMTFKCPLGYGITGVVMQTGEAYLSGDVTADARAQSVPGWRGGEKSCILVPMQVEGRRVGVVRISRMGLHRFTKDDLRLAESYAVQAALILEHGRILKELSDLSMTDPVTGLFTQEHLYQVLPIEINHAKRKGTALTLAVVSSHPLAYLQRRLGDQEGAGHLRHISQAIQANLRPTDSAYRCKDDRLVLLLPNASIEEARLIGSRTRQVVAEMQEAAGLYGTVDVVYARWPDDAQDAEALIQAARKALEEGHTVPTEEAVTAD